ncbi:MAG: hypothetical protein MZV65_40630 [Chromatiales bacterium]|nr:hypothetical protein [Chromatiales bacterium]
MPGPEMTLIAGQGAQDGAERRLEAGLGVVDLGVAQAHVGVGGQLQALADLGVGRRRSSSSRWRPSASCPSSCRSSTGSRRR